MKHILTILFVLFASGLLATDHLAEAEYYQKKAEGYRREAAYYEQKAKGYEREAEYYIKKAGHGVFARSDFRNSQANRI